MSEPQVPMSSAQTITALDQQLKAKYAEAYSLRAQTEAVDAEIKALANLLNGAKLGRKFAEESAEQADDKAPADE